MDLHKRRTSAAHTYAAVAEVQALAPDERQEHGACAVHRGEDGGVQQAHGSEVADHRKAAPDCPRTA